jgi:DivIVA domain-containing protein
MEGERPTRSFLAQVGMAAVQSAIYLTAAGASPPRRVLTRPERQPEPVPQVVVSWGLPRMAHMQRCWSAMALDSPLRREDKVAEITLSGVRAELRTALRARVEAAKWAAATPAVPFVGAPKLGRIADSFWYASALGQRSTLRATLRCNCVSATRCSGRCSGLIVLAPGRLIARIEETLGKPNRAGDRLLGALTAFGALELIDDALLSDAQDVAVGSGLGRDVTLISGADGPAKRHTIGSIGAHLYRRSRSLLVVSHTNKAADRALVEIAEQLGGDVAPGALLCLGIPSDRRLRERDDLLLDSIGTKRQEELRARQARLRTKKLAKQARIGESERLIKVAAWAAEGRAELADFLLRLDAVYTAETAHRQVAEEVAHRANDEAELRVLLAEGQAAARRARDATRLCADLPHLADELKAAREAVAVADAAVSEARWNYQKARELAPLFARERALPAVHEQRRTVEALADRQAEARHEADAARESLREAQETRAPASSTNAIQRRFRGLVFHTRVRRVVAWRRATHANAQLRLDGISERLRRAAAVLAELEQLDRRLAPWRKLESPANQEAQLERREAERDLAMAAETEVEQRRAKLERQLAVAAEAVARFRKMHAVTPLGVVARVEPQLAELRHVREKLRETERRADDLRNALDADLSARLAAIEALGLGHGSSPETPQERFVEVALAQFEARRLADEIDVAALKADVTDCWRGLSAIDGALASIDQELEAIRPAAITDLMVIGTTVSRVYLWNEIQDRRSDTVILDDASVTPTPILWIVARLADAKVVVIGDSKRTPADQASGAHESPRRSPRTGRSGPVAGHALLNTPNADSGAVAPPRRGRDGLAEVGGRRHRSHTPGVVEKGRDRADDTAGERPVPAYGRSTRSQPVVTDELRDASFASAVRGYDRREVDRYVQRVNRVIAELEVSRSPESAVRHALDRVADQTGGILQRARETAEEITHTAGAEAEETTARARAEANEIIAHAKSAAEQMVAEAETEAARRVKQGESELETLRAQGQAARADAEETTARAKVEGSEIVAKAKTEAERIVARANSEAAQRMERAEQQLEALRTQTEAAMRGLRADTDAIEEERRNLFNEIHELATRLEQLVSPPEEGVEPEAEESKAAAADAEDPSGDALREART